MCTRGAVFIASFLFFTIYTFFFSQTKWCVWDGGGGERERSSTLYLPCIVDSFRDENIHLFFLGVGGISLFFFGRPMVVLEMKLMTGGDASGNNKTHPDRRIEWVMIDLASVDVHLLFESFPSLLRPHLVGVWFSDVFLPLPLFWEGVGCFFKLSLF